MMSRLNAGSPDRAGRRDDLETQRLEPSVDR